MSGQAESSTASTILRNDDPLSLALRNGAALDMDDIARLNRAVSPAHDALSSLGTASVAVFTACEESTVTKPTSIGTSHPNNIPKAGDKGKGRASYTSSLSVAHGSGSEAEAQHDAVLRDTLLAMGDWTAGGSVSADTLKGSARSKRRHHNTQQLKRKKPIVEIIQHEKPASVSSDGDVDTVVTTVHKRDLPRKSSSYAWHPPGAKSLAADQGLRKRTTQHEDAQGEDEASVHVAQADEIRFAEEGRLQPVVEPSPSRKALTSTRVYVLVGLIVMMFLTVAVSILGAHHTGKKRIACTKGIVFGTTVLLAGFTVTSMIVARCRLQDALLASLVVIVIGFTFLHELDDFM